MLQRMTLLVAALFCAAILVAAEPATKPALKQNPNWPEGSSLKINLAIPQPAEPKRYRMPYVVVWIADGQNKPVRTLELWADRPATWKYLTGWWTLAGSRLKAPYLEKISKYPHKPGEYEMIWDGQDDSGAFAKAGIYTVHCEVFRERGAHEDVGLQLKCIDQPDKISAKGTSELGAVSASFGTR